MLGYSSSNQGSPWSESLIATWLLLAVWPSRLSSPWKKSWGIINWKEMWGMALTPTLTQFRIQSIKRFIYTGSEVIMHNPLLSRYHSVICKVCSALSLLLCLSVSPSHMSVSLWLLYAHTYILKIHGNGSPSVLHNFLQKHQCLYCSFSEPLMSLKNLMWLNEGSYSISDTETNEGKVEQIETQLLLVSFMMSSDAGYYNPWKSLQI